jgi:UDP-glucose 4-epimerase
MKNNLMITGGLGYVGSFTSKEFLRLYKTKPLSIDNLSRGNSFAKKYCRNEKVNISNKGIAKIIKKNKINSVLHLAAYTCVRESIKKKKKYHINNYESQIKFINLLKKNGINIFIFSSSLSIFDKNKVKKRPSPYAKYKAEIEAYLKKMSGPKFKVVILRYPNIIGANEKGTIGEKNKYITRIVPSFHKNMIQNKKNILFYSFKKKKFPVRNYLHVNDIAKLNVKLFKNIQKIKKNFTTFNILNKNFYSNFDVLKILSKINNVKLNFILKKINSKESIKPTYAIKDDIFKLLKFEPSLISLENILKTNIKWFKKIY